LLKAATATVFQYTGFCGGCKIEAEVGMERPRFVVMVDTVLPEGKQSSQGMVQQKFYLSIA
jgi:hypothetical protein